MKNICVSILILFLIGTSVSSSFIVLGLPGLNENTASISGYITNIDDFPIENAKISFSCGDETYQCYSNEIGYYHKENLPLLYCIWNITAAKTGYQLSAVEMPIEQKTWKNFTLFSVNPVRVEIEVIRGWHLPAPLYEIKNTGDTSIHNVVLINTTVDGPILYNNRDVVIADVIEPGDWAHFDSNTWFIGFGMFSIEISVTCDEGIFSSDVTNGFIIGSLIFIP